jgi:hypothetical protein
MYVGGGLVDRLPFSSPVSTVYALNVIVPIDPLVALYMVQVVLVRSSGRGRPTLIVAWLSLLVAFMLVSLLLLLLLLVQAS